MKLFVGDDVLCKNPLTLTCTLVSRRTCKILVEIEFREDSTLLSGEVLKPEMRSLILKLSEKITLKMSFRHLQNRVESLEVTIK